MSLAQAVLHKPDLLVLDEPSNGLDPRQIIELRGLLRHLAQDCAVLVTSHILAEIERTADRVAILLDGRLLTVERIAQEALVAPVPSALEALFLRPHAGEGHAMSQVATLVGKEVRALFTSPIAYAVIAVFVVLSGYTFTVSLIVAKQATLVHIFFQAAVQLILLVPLITMRQFAEERRSGTLELLLTAPAAGNRHRRREIHRLHGGAVGDDRPDADLCRRARRPTAIRTGGRSTAAISASCCWAPPWCRSA